MKRYINLLMFCSAFLLLFQFLTGCSEDDTLEGAKEIYITISPKDPFIMVGDTIKLYAEVVNQNGDSIDTPVLWKSDDENLVKIYDNQMIAQGGAQGKSTKIRAILENGKYAIITVTVITHSVNGISPFTDKYYTYDAKKDTVWFAIDPVQLLLDYAPKIENSDPELLVPDPDQPIYVDKKIGKVGYVFSSGNQAGTATITLSIGAAGSEKTGSTEVLISPLIKSSFDESFDNITSEMFKVMDINKQDTVWVNTQITPSYAVDFQAAMQYYNWSVTGNAAQLLKVGVEDVEYRGHRAYAVFRSGGLSGQSIVKFECNGTELTATLEVQNFVTQYPVDQLLVDKSSVEVPVGSAVYILPTVEPVSSYGIWVPVFTPNDPSIVSVIGYNGTEMGLKGLKVGETDVIVTSNDKSIIVHVKVTESVQSVVMTPGNQVSVFEGQTTQWHAKVNSSGGSVIKPTWRSDDTSVASVDSEGIITGLSAGKVNIVAEAGGVSSVPATLTVQGIPMSDVVYNDANTDMEGNAAYMDNENIIVMVAPTIIDPFSEVQFVIRPHTPVSDVVNATYTMDNSQINIILNGSEVAISSGTLTIGAGSDSELRSINADVTVTIGSRSFKIKLNNLTSY